MKRFVIALVLVVGIKTTYAQQQTAKINFANETISLGRIQQGKPTTEIFKFKNNGKIPLIITDVKPTCGCTTAGFTNYPVKPGRKGIVKVTYNAASLGPFNKTITVTSNADTPMKTLTFTGEVIKQELYNK